jgi:uncharacterized protein involved in exopolysaccharide biosynthesis
MAPEMDERRDRVERDRYESDEDEVNLLDYLRVLKKRGRMILGLCFVSVATAFVLSYFVLPKIYESTASILPPADPKGGGGLSTLLATSGAAQFLGGALPFPSSNKDIFVAMLKSRTMADEVIRELDLLRVYGLQDSNTPMQSARGRLQGATNIRASREGVITVTVEDRDPKRAADVANFYLATLDRLNRTLNLTEAGRNRAFIESRLKETERDLRRAEEDLRGFQERNKAVVLQDQAKAAVEGAAKLKGEIMAAEVQLEVVRGFSTEQNPQVIHLKTQIQEMKRQFTKMQYGQGMELPPVSKNPGEAQPEIVVPFARVPRVGLDLARLTRETKVQQTVFELLTQQYEQAKIAEARDSPIVQVLDRAVPAEWKSKPKTRQNMMIAGAISLFAGVFLAFFLEYWARITRERADAARPAVS